MTVRISGALAARAKLSGGVAILARLRAGLDARQKNACVHSLRGKAYEQRLYAELDLVTARLGQDALNEFAMRREVIEIRAPEDRVEAVIQTGTVNQDLDELITAKNRSWGVNKMRVPALWKQGIRGTGVVVAHLDTGVHEGHAAFRDRIVHRAVIDGRGNFHHTGTMKDDWGHGSHTAGTICAVKVNKQRIGVAYFARLACATVLGGGDQLKRIVRALEWVLALRNGHVNIRVLNLSLGFKGIEPAFRPLVWKLEDAGILTVAAVGNDGPESSRAPGNYPETLAVGACDRNNKVWRDSASNDWTDGSFVPDLVAPGVEIPSARRDRALGWRVDQGSSMATAHVSGLAALLFSKHKDATPAAVRQAILDGCVPLDGPSPARQGYGVPNAVLALAALDKAMA